MAQALLNHTFRRPALQPLNPGLKPRKGMPLYVSWTAAFLLAAAYFLLNMTFMQQFLDWDQIVYSSNILSALRPGRLPLFNPHHLHLEISGKWWHQIMLFFFEDQGLTDPIFNNRIKSLLTASLGLYFFVLFLRDLTGKLSWGLIGGFMAGACHGYMSYATQVDTPIYPAVGLILTLWVLRKIEVTPRHSFYWFLGAAVILFLSVMGHQYMAISCLIFCVALGLPPYFFPDWNPWQVFKKRKKKKFDAQQPEIDQKPIKRYIGVISCALLAVFLIAGAFFWAGKTQYNFSFDNPHSRDQRGPLAGGRTFQEWLFLYAQLDMWGHGIERFDPRSPFRGMTDGFVSQIRDTSRFNKKYTFEYKVDEPANPNYFTKNQLAYFTWGLVFLTAALFPLLWTTYKRTFLFTLSSAVSFSIFTTWWEAYYFEFWLVPSLLFITLAVMILNYLGDRINLFLGKGGQVPFMAYLLFLGVIFFNHNVQHYLVYYSRIYNVEGAPPNYSDDFVYGLFGGPEVYKHPGNVHQEAFGTRKGEVYLSPPRPR